MYFLSSPVVIGGDMNINEKGIQDSLRKNPNGYCGLGGTGVKYPGAQ